MLEPDVDAVIQDYSSQQVLGPLGRVIDVATKFSCWDCCAASGGKSILLRDHYHHAELTVSDLRESILFNLRNRFKRAGIKNYTSFVADLSLVDLPVKKIFDLVICDAPCSGSGTWSRTPEQLLFFKNEKVIDYSSLQKKIALNATKGVRQGGYFLYITCSVFSKENEGVVEFIRSECGMQLLSAEYIKGYQEKADTLFTALFLRS